MSQSEAMQLFGSSSAVRLVCRDGAATIVWLVGELDATTVRELNRVLSRATAADCNDLVIDVTDVTFMDAATLGALVGSRNVLRTQKRYLSIRGSARCVDRLFEICDVASFFDARPTPTRRRRKAGGKTGCGNGESAASRWRANRQLRLEVRNERCDDAQRLAEPHVQHCSSRACGLWSEPGICTLHRSSAA